MNALTAAARINQATTPLDDPNATLDDLALLWVEAKGAVLNAQRFLDKVTDRIAADVGTKDEGAFTVHCDHFKVTTNQPINRSVARSEAMDVLRSLPEDIGQAIFTFKPSLNVKPVSYTHLTLPTSELV